MRFTSVEGKKRTKQLRFLRLLRPGLCTGFPYWPLFGHNPNVAALKELTTG